MLTTYESWLRGRGYDGGTVATQLARTARVEQHYGDVDKHYASDGLNSVLDLLRYSTEDERRGRANPTPIPINGVLRTNLAS